MSRIASASRSAGTFFILVFAASTPFWVLGAIALYGEPERTGRGARASRPRAARLRLARQYLADRSCRIAAEPPPVPAHPWTPAVRGLLSSPSADRGRASIGPPPDHAALLPAGREAPRRVQRAAAGRTVEPVGRQRPRGRTSHGRDRGPQARGAGPRGGRRRDCPLLAGVRPPVANLRAPLHGNRRTNVVRPRADGGIVMAGRFAWAAIAIADLGVLLYGFLALAMPESLTPGYEAFTGHSWPDLVASDPRIAEFLVLLFRLLGALNVAAGLAGLLIAVVPFRSGARWSWFALLARERRRIRRPDHVRPGRRCDRGPGGSGAGGVRGHSARPRTQLPPGCPGARG